MGVEDLGLVWRAWDRWGGYGVGGEGMGCVWTPWDGCGRTEMSVDSLRSVLRP